MGIQKSLAFSFTELLVAMALVAALLLSLSATWLYATHSLSDLHQERLHAQEKKNLEIECFARPNYK